MRARIQLPLQTADLIAGFMAWVILSSLLPAIKQDIAIPENQLALLTAVPVVLGSVLRVPFGYLADLLGARVMFTASFVLLLAPVWLISSATTWQELLVGGVFLGLGGAVFSIGVTSLPAYYPQERHGFVNGVYGFGNVGTALTTWLAPVAAAAFGLACGRATLPHTAGRIRRAELCTGRPQRTACEDAHYEPVARHLAR